MDFLELNRRHQGCDTRWLRGFWEGALHKVLVSTFFFLFVRDMLPFPPPALAFFPWRTRSLPAGRAATAIATAEQLRGMENLHWAKWFDIKHVYQEAAGTLTCWKGPLWSAFFTSGKGEDHSSEVSGEAGESILRKASFNLVLAVFSEQAASGTSPAALLPCSHLWDTPPKLKVVNLKTSIWNNE